MASRQSQKRLAKEYKSIQANPPPYIDAKPNDENILEWHYVITGPPQTPFEGGQYHGMLRFPAEYPFKPPSISMITPNGRFTTNMRLCLSMSDYHPDTWNPAWSVATILTGLLSFMTGDESTTGSISTTDAVKRRLARDSRSWNNTQNPRFKKLLPDLYKENVAVIAEQARVEEKKAAAPEPEALADLSKLDPEDRARVLVEPRTPGSSSRLGMVVGVVLVAVAVVFLKR
ncbi:ubiquitin-conjugating enzyme E2 6 [Diutina catenulata]